MNIRTVYAILHFKTPHGDLKKVVTWSYFESQAIISTSSTSKDAFNKFLEYGRRIIGSSISELKYLDSISFFERKRYENTLIVKKYCKTDTIKIVKNGDEIIEFKVE